MLPRGAAAPKAGMAPWRDSGVGMAPWRDSGAGMAPWRDSGAHGTMA